MLQPIREVYNYIADEPLDNVTCSYTRHWLEEHYPEVEWKVEIVREGSYGTVLQITPYFNNPQEETYYTLKWS